MFGVGPMGLMLMCIVIVFGWCVGLSVFVLMGWVCESVRMFVLRSMIHVFLVR